MNIKDHRVVLMTITIGIKTMLNILN